ncbi:oligopeptide transporter ATP-binding component [Aeromonas veronii]|nr:oligopeptide transporter ATP-binding component [Aeromonas veronii]MBO0398903.1 oligopeptide transporter ATP-binding component [Aeromonas veronii]
MNAVNCGQQSSMPLKPFNDGRERACHWVSDAINKGAN